MPPKKPVVDPADAPAVDTEQLGPDADGNPPEPWNEERFLRDAKKAAAERTWHRMASLEAQARTIEAAGVADGAVTGPDGQPQRATVNVPARERVDTTEQIRKEAGRLRRVAAALLAASNGDELDLIKQRIQQLTANVDTARRELALHKDFRDNPDEYGYVMLDAQSPILHDVEVGECARLEAQMADMQAELDYYESMTTDT